MWDDSTIPEPLGLSVIFQGATRGVTALVDTGATGTVADILVPMDLYRSLAKGHDEEQKGQKAQGAGGEQISITEPVLLHTSVRLSDAWFPMELKVSGATMQFNDECPALLTWTGLHRLDRK